MNDADKKAFSEAYAKWKSSDDMISPYEYFWQAACEWRDSQVKEPVIYQCRMQPTWTDRQPWTPWSECTKGTYEDCRRVRVNGDWRYESRALYATPPAAQINQQLVEALAFYADPLRYQGPNQEVDEGDKYTPDGFPYRMDVTRDGGEIARAALAATQMRGDA